MIWKTLCALIAFTLPAAGQGFDAALAQWLDGDDMPALEAMATAAQGGDVKAQLFLGQVATKPHLWPDSLAAMGRRERNALLRAPGGLSGKDWTAIAAQNDPLAAAFDQARRPELKAAALFALMEYGEVPPVSKALSSLLGGGDWSGVLDIVTHRNAPSEWRSLAPAMRAYMADQTYTSVGSARIPALNWASVSPRQAFEDPTLLVREGVRLRSEPAAAPFLSFCAAVCHETQASQCLGAIWIASNSYPPMQFVSPVESFVSTGDYRNSPRAARDLRKVIETISYRWTERDPLIVAELSSCAGEALGQD